MKRELGEFTPKKIHNNRGRDKGIKGERLNWEQEEFRKIYEEGCGGMWVTDTLEGTIIREGENPMAAL